MIETFANQLQEDIWNLLWRDYHESGSSGLGWSASAVANIVGAEIEPCEDILSLFVSIGLLEERGTHNGVDFDWKYFVLEPRKK